MRSGQHPQDENARRPAMLSRYVRQRHNHYIADLVSRFPVDRVLAIKCGNGVQLAGLAETREPVSFTGVHPTAHLASWQDLQLPRPNLNFAVADSLSLPFEDRSFDVVTAVGVFNRQRDPGPLLREIRRVCAGHLIASVPLHPYTQAINLATLSHVRRLGQSPVDAQRYTREQFRDLLAGHGSEVRTTSRLPWIVGLARLHSYNMRDRF